MKSKAMNKIDKRLLGILSKHIKVPILNRRIQALQSHQARFSFAFIHLWQSYHDNQFEIMQQALRCLQLPRLPETGATMDDVYNAVMQTEANLSDFRETTLDQPMLALLAIHKQFERAETIQAHLHHRNASIRNEKGKLSFEDVEEIYKEAVRMYMAKYEIQCQGS